MKPDIHRKGSMFPATETGAYLISFWMTRVLPALYISLLFRIPNALALRRVLWSPTPQGRGRAAPPPIVDRMSRLALLATC